jgi:carbamoylphosphate synthase large subunit
LKTILITSAGSQVGEGILAALDDRRQHLRVVGINSDARSPSLYACDRVHLVPETGDTERFKARFSEIVALEQPDLIIPGRDDDIVFLATLAATDPLLSRRVLAGGPAVGRILRNKLAIAHFARSQGLPFVETMATADLRIDERMRAFIAMHGWPLLIKPEEGQGSQEVWLIEDMGRLEPWCDRPGYVVQPYLDRTPSLLVWLREFRQGVPLHSTAPDVVQDVVQVLIGPQGELLGAFGMRSEMRAGRSCRVVPNEDETLRSLGLRFGEVLAREGWRGPLNIQTRRVGSGYVPFEVNGRFNGTTSARTALGFDEMRLTLKAFLDLDIGPSRPTASDVVLRRLRDIPLETRQVAELETTGMWEMPVRASDPG